MNSNHIEMLLKNEILSQTSSSKIFKSERFFSKEFFPSSIYFREKELRELTILFKKLLSFEEHFDKFFQTVTLVGPVGCGKSLVARLFGIEIEKLSALKNSNVKLIYRQINCRRNNSIFLLLFDLMKSLLPHFPNRGFSSRELLNMLNIILEQTNSYLILTLDEFDYLMADKEIDIFFQNLSIESINKNVPEKRRISLIFITKNKDFLLLVDPSNKYGFVNNIIKFEKYSSNQLKEILFLRSRDGFKEGVLSPSLLDYLVESIQDICDVRLALELLWKSGLYAESEKTDIIERDQVKKAIESIKIN